VRLISNSTNNFFFKIFIFLLPHDPQIYWIQILCRNGSGSKTLFFSYFYFLPSCQLCSYFSKEQCLKFFSVFFSSINTLWSRSQNKIMQGTGQTFTFEPNFLSIRNNIWNGFRTLGCHKSRDTFPSIMNFF
jgi:hypothetical protein